MIAKKVIKSAIKRLVDTYHPHTIYLFGSYAWGNPTDDSDLDLLIVVDHSDQDEYNRPVAGHHALGEWEYQKIYLSIPRKNLSKKQKMSQRYAIKLIRSELNYMQNHRAWLNKASHDLKGAKVLLQENINDLAVYHAHQSAEKALKGFLSFKFCSIQKSHDLVLLTELCCRYDQSFEELRFIVESLNPLGTLTRYPSEKPDPDLNTTRLAIEKAEKLFLFVENKIQNCKT